MYNPYLKLFSKISFLVVASWISFSCQDKSQINLNQNQEHLDFSIQNDSIITLKGVLNITTDGILLFQCADSSYSGISKIQLIPSTEYLVSYVFKAYNSFLYLRNFDDKFWVLVEGNFIPSVSENSPRRFKFSFIALISESEAMSDSMW